MSLSVVKGKLLAGLSVVLWGDVALRAVLCSVVLCREKSFTLDRFHPRLTQRVNRQRTGFQGDAAADPKQYR